MGNREEHENMMNTMTVTVRMMVVRSQKHPPTETQHTTTFGEKKKQGNVSGLSVYVARAGGGAFVEGSVGGSHTEAGRSCGTMDDNASNETSNTPGWIRRKGPRLP